MVSSQKLSFRLPQLGLACVALFALGSCTSGDDFLIQPEELVRPNFDPNSEPALSAVDVQLLLEQAATLSSSTTMSIAVTDRTGQLRGLYSSGGFFTRRDEIATSLARTTSFFSNSQAPLTSRTVETLSTFHFPPTFGDTFVADGVDCPDIGTGDCNGFGDFGPYPTVLAPSRQTTGIVGTPQGALWQIESTNRGAPIAGLGLTAPDETLFNPGQEFPRSIAAQAVITGVNPFELPGQVQLPQDFPSSGIVRLPGAVPLYLPDLSDPSILRVVGGIGVYITDGFNGDPLVGEAEYVAFTAAQIPSTQGNPFAFPVELATGSNEGAIFLAGILLPYVREDDFPENPTTGTFNPANYLVPPQAGRAAPFSNIDDPSTYLIGPRPGVTPAAGGLDLADVQSIVRQCVESAERTRSLIRLNVTPDGNGGVNLSSLTPSSVIITVTDVRGLILAHFRMIDTLCDAVDVVPAKARSAVYYSQPLGLNLGNLSPQDAFPQLPYSQVGPDGSIATSTTAMGFLSQPFFPPGIDSSPFGPGPAFQLAQSNLLPQQSTRLGSSPPDPGYQNGLTWFPGAVPLYKDGVLVGGLGVSGDGVENNDLIAQAGAVGFEPPLNMRVDEFTFNGIGIPYLKFIFNPGG